MQNVLNRSILLLLEAAGVQLSADDPSILP